jgi:glycosyltransferase involved in cell wall biosynthesis
MIKGKNGVSIIVPTFNEDKNIINLLKSVATQTDKNFEVIIVDDRSSDQTINKTEEYSKERNIRLKIIASKKHLERGLIRNLGAKNAHHRYLLFIDADMVLSQNLVKECLNKVNRDKKVKALIIPEESIGEGFWTACRALEKRCYIGDDRIEAARFFEIEAFWDIGGWDKEMISGEDWDLTRRIRERYKIDRITSPIYHNEGRLTLLKAMKKKFYYATQANSYLSKNPINTYTVFFFIIRPAYFRNWRLLIKDPVHALGMFVLKSLEYIVGVVGLIYLKTSRI